MAPKMMPLRKRPSSAPAAVVQPAPPEEAAIVQQNEGTNKAEAKQSAQKGLEANVQAFVEQIKAKKVPLSAEALKGTFTPSEMSSLWQKLKTARKKADMSVTEAWEELCKMGKGVGKEEKKASTLLSFLTQGPEQWKQHLVHEVEKIKSSKKAGSEQRLYYRGELDRIHGEEEAEQHIRQGKLKQVLDKWGDVAYVKTTHWSAQETEHSKSAEIERHARLDNDSFHSTAESFAKWFAVEEGQQPFKLADNPKKRPASAMGKSTGASSSASGSGSASASQALMLEDIPPKDESTLLQKSQKAAKSALNALQKLVLKLLDHHSRCKGDRLSKATKDELKVAASEAEGLVKSLRLEVAKRNPEQKKLASLTVESARLQKRSVALFANRHFFVAKA